MRTFLSLWRGVIRIREPLVSLAEICTTVAETYGVSAGEIRGPRGPVRVHPARFAFYYAAILAGYSYPSTGWFCGRRDHSSVWAGARRHAEENHLPMPATREFRHDPQITQSNPFRRAGC